MNLVCANKTKAIILIQALLFFCLIVFGITGSSISNIRSQAPGLVSSDDKILIGHPKGIRGDEWAVNTLISIGQYQNRESKNPRMNDSLGPTPRDMSIIHDTGVPTSELSTLSKINLWGFFIFDLRRALAWDWWIPVFIGLNGIWLLLNLICPGQPYFNFSLALLFTLAPECVVWSNWPLLQVGTASLAVSLAIIALKNNNMLVSLLLALCTGFLISWFALQLYLPRLIPVAIIAIASYIGYCINNHVKFFTKNNCVFIIYTLLIASCLIFDWYSRNFEGITRMLNSSYPGQRRIYGGAPVTGWDFNYVRGWLFPITSKESFFANYTKMPSNPCEAMSYIGLFIPIAVSVLYYVFKEYRKINYIILFNFGVLILFIAYEYIGLPEFIGKITFLNRSMPGRSIIGIGFASVILLAFLYKNKNVIAVKYKLLFLSLYLVPFIIFFFRNQDLLNYFRENYLSKLIYIVLFIIIIHATFLYRIKYVTLALLLFIAPITLFWNPIIIAPSHVGVNLPEQIVNDQSKVKYGGRFLVSDWFVTTNIFLASGNKVMNATSHYVDPYMFNHFYSKLDNPETYNRFNHLMVFIDNSKPDIEISLGGGDWIKMRLNAADFDFSVFPVDYMAVRNSRFIKGLNANSKLEFINNVGDFSFYRVKHL